MLCIQYKMFLQLKYYGRVMHTSWNIGYLKLFKYHAIINLVHMVKWERAWIQSMQDNFFSLFTSAPDRFCKCEWICWPCRKSMNYICKRLVITQLAFILQRKQLQVPFYSWTWVVFGCLFATWNIHALHRLAILKTIPCIGKSKKGLCNAQVMSPVEPHFFYKWPQEVSW